MAPDDPPRVATSAAPSAAAALSVGGALRPVPAAAEASSDTAENDDVVANTNKALGNRGPQSSSAPREVEERKPSKGEVIQVASSRRAAGDSGLHHRDEVSSDFSGDGEEQTRSMTDVAAAGGDVAAATVVNVRSIGQMGDGGGGGAYSRQSAAAEDSTSTSAGVAGGWAFATSAPSPAEDKPAAGAATATATATATMTVVDRFQKDKWPRYGDRFSFSDDDEEEDDVATHGRKDTSRAVPRAAAATASVAAASAPDDSIVSTLTNKTRAAPRRVPSFSSSDASAATFSDEPLDEDYGVERPRTTASASARPAAPGGDGRFAPVGGAIAEEEEEEDEDEEKGEEEAGWGGVDRAAVGRAGVVTVTPKPAPAHLTEVTALAGEPEISGSAAPAPASSSPGLVSSSGDREDGESEAVAAAAAAGDGRGRGEPSVSVVREFEDWDDGDVNLRGR